jgi:hypothetical protein
MRPNFVVIAMGALGLATEAFALGDAAPSSTDPAALEEETSTAPADVERDAPVVDAADPTGDLAKELLHDVEDAFTFGAYAEAFYQWNLNAPSNGITNFRGFDNRHNSFTISNVALDAQWDRANVIGRVTLQVGHTPATYYAGEPAVAGASAANPSSGLLWQFVQQAYAGYRFALLDGLTVAAGLFLSPIGPESIAVRDNWNWSRSNLFFGLPFYHTGLRGTLALTDAWDVTLAVYNGWNSVIDNNDEKSVSAQTTYRHDDMLSLSLLYFGGVERARDAPEGRAWRHLFDAHAQWSPTSWLSLLGHANAGFEPHAFGLSNWAASALAVRTQIGRSLFVAIRGDAFYEHVAENEHGRAASIFWPAPWVSSGTTTIDYRPHERVSMRLELRRDLAGANMFFGGDVSGDGDADMFVANRRFQDTVTVGVTTWL